MSQHAGDPDYTLVWPPQIFREEVGRIISRGEALNYSVEWLDEVKTLVRQAFSSSVPGDDLEAVLTGPPASFEDYSREPF